MIRLEYQILAAVALDLILGDPRWLPHPVRGIAWLATNLERLTRRVFRWERLAGIVTAVLIYSAAGGFAYGLVRLAGLAHPIAADAVSIILIYTTVAARDMAKHSMAVFRPLVAGDLPATRKAVAMIVGRDTAELDEAGVVRAAVESVAESTVDGVTAPLFFAVIAGPVGAMVYRAVNTLDSMFGHKDDRYIRFGWASARVDDVANFIPARITAPLIALAAGLPGMRCGRAFRTLIRDGRKHQSPNSGLSEAAMAGALGLQLGGRTYYGGEPLDKPTIGDALVAPAPAHIRKANGLMFASAGLFLAICLGARIMILRLLTTWRP